MGAVRRFLALIAFAIFILLPLSSFLLIPLLGFYVMYVLLSVVASLAIGLVWGIVIPMRTLRRTPDSHPYNSVLEIATPAAVRRGEVTRGEPKGPAAEFGWDLAWPTYIPYQVSRDQKAVIKATHQVTSRIRFKWTHWWPEAEFSAWLFRWLLKLAHSLTVGVLLYSLLGSIWLGAAVWLAITWLTRIVFSGGQRLTNNAVKHWEKYSMKRGMSLVRCPRCYRDSHMPSFVCPTGSCGVIHRDVSPGIFGIRSRLCACSIRIPHTVARASRELTAVCPFCEEDLPQGAGGRRVVVMPVFGTVGAGKTQFLSSIVTGLHQESDNTDHPLTLKSLTDSATQFLNEAVDNANVGNAPMKTEYRDRPEGLPYLVEHSSGDFELQLMDAAGESFVETERSRSLGYLDIANTLIFIFDPFSIDEVREELENRNLREDVQVAQGNAQDAYGSVVDRLRADNEDLNKKNLAVVVSKADVLANLYPSTPIPHVSDDVRHWLYDLGGDHLIRRVEMDFRRVKYFVVDSVHGNSDDSQLSPLAILDWTVTNHGGQALFPPAIEAVNAEKTSQTAPQAS